MAKELKWYGKTEQEVKQMEFKDFLEVIPARQRRSLKRGLNDAQKAFMKRIDAGENNVKTHCRDMVVVPAMLGKTINVYDGKSFVPVIVNVEMLGHFLGEFSHTRKLVSHSSAGVGATRSSKAISAR